MHCFSGLNLSPAFVIAYLIKERKCTAKQAIKVINRTQKIPRPIPGFMFQLENYELIVGAERKRQVDHKPSEELKQARPKTTTHRRRNDRSSSREAKAWGPLYSGLKPIKEMFKEGNLSASQSPSRRSGGNSPDA